MLKFQAASCDAEALLPYWMNLLPLTHDLEEAKTQNDFLADLLLKSSSHVVGAGLERLPQVVAILGEVCQKKQSEVETLEKLSVVIASLSQDPAVAEQF